VLRRQRGQSLEQGRGYPRRAQQISAHDTFSHGDKVFKGAFSQDVSGGASFSTGDDFFFDFGNAKGNHAHARSAGDDTVNYRGALGRYRMEEDDIRTKLWDAHQ
jgi:hypothetical protein